MSIDEHQLDFLLVPIHDHKDNLSNPCPIELDFVSMHLQCLPGYLINYLYAEKLTFRKKALATTEVANLATFLLSQRSSGINGQGIIIDAGMGLNYFDSEVVQSSMKIDD